MHREIHAVTGAFGYSGKYIAARLLAQGRKVITLTNSLHRPNPFGERVQACAFNFDSPAKMTASLKGVSVFYNTYWVRFNHPMFTHADAVRNTTVMFEAAKKAGVEHVVHISITNPSADSPLEYFRGKAQLERALKDSGLSYTILRPAVLFGNEDILINNIAWALRRLPVFGVFGNGRYRLQPIYVDDLAGLAVEYGDKRENITLDAIGPETFTYRDLVKTIAEIIGKRRPIVSVPPRLGYLAGALIGKMVGDVMITRDEVQGLMANLLFVQSPPAATTRFTDWAKRHSQTLGLHYASELARRLDGKTPAP
ncbi:MAG: NAD-dependent epimerase/dehydratase family protein [Desulfobacteraceae bacterium]|nr:MAG: NAD-dependent epimerase/dehydratase family protein [Desulfobacteraceae bacterium]